MSRNACSIPEYESDTVVLTEGESNSDALSTVERYDLNGLAQTLPSLNQAREGHGCGYFYYKGGIKVKFTFCVSQSMPGSNIWVLGEEKDEGLWSWRLESPESAKLT